jgi:hypothetical protein
MNPPATICLITPGHVSSTPRLVKEADALVAAGYRVHVVAGDHYAPAARLDASLLADARWQYTSVPLRRNLPALGRKALRKLARLALAAGCSGVRLAALAHHAETFRLAATAARIEADFYLGHCLAGLPAAAFAARRRGVAYGFDLEDFHEEETETALKNTSDRRAARLLGTRLLPGCRHLSAASPLIAEKCEQTYGVHPVVLLNVFPLSEAPAAPVDLPPPSETVPLRLYWFSQTIGPGRGLEAVIDTLALMRTPAELSLRGLCTETYRRTLQTRATAAGLRTPLRFLPSAPPVEMVRLAAGYHLGLSVEASYPPNRDICLTNKIFTCLLAGVPVALTPTRAQSALATALGEAALLLDFSGQPVRSAAALDVFAGSPDRLAAARTRAWSLARDRYNWDREQSAFLASISRALEAN